MLRPVEVNALPNYRLFLRYPDGVAGEVDLSEYVGKGVFRLWNDPQLFARVTIGAGGELHWTDQVELCADALYLRLTGKTIDEPLE